MTYLEIVNKVLRRLRENEVSSVSENTYSKLIGEFVNDVKREMETMWDWDVLRKSITVSTVANTYNYSVVGIGTEFRVTDIYNTTSKYKLEYRPSEWFNATFLTQTAQTGSPIYYNFNGVDNNNDNKVDLFPIPDGTYSITFNVTVPQADLVNNTDVPLVDNTAIIYGAVARAIEERGDDGGLVAAEQRYRSYVSDLIAIEANRRFNEITWIKQ